MGGGTGSTSRPTTKKVTINELRNIVRQIIKEESMLNELDDSTYRNLRNKSTSDDMGVAGRQQIYRIKKLATDRLDSQFIGKKIGVITVKSIHYRGGDMSGIPRIVVEDGNSYFTIYENGTFKYVVNGKESVFNNMSDYVLLSKMAKAYFDVDVSPKKWERKSVD